MVKYYRLMAIHPSKNFKDGKEIKLLIDEQHNITELCGGHNLYNCRFVIETIEEGKVVKEQIIKLKKMEEDLEYETFFDEEIKENIFSFDGLYNNCYIRLEANNIEDIKKAINEIFTEDTTKKGVNEK